MGLLQVLEHDVATGRYLPYMNASGMRPSIVHLACESGTLQGCLAPVSYWLGWYIQVC